MEGSGLTPSIEGLSRHVLLRDGEIRVSGHFRAQSPPKLRSRAHAGGSHRVTMTLANCGSRLSESNRRPTHYECVALAD